MKIFYFITKSEEGGAQVVVSELLRGHKERGDNVVVMASGRGWLAQKTKEYGYQYSENPWMIKTYNPVILWKALMVYRSTVNSFNPDIISCHSTFSGFIGRVGLLNKRVVIYTAHGWAFTEGVSLVRKISAIVAEWFAGHFAKKIICVSHFDKNVALKYGVVPSEKIVVVHNGVSVESFRNNGLKKDIVTITFCGRFVVPKRQDLLIQAYALLPKEVQEKTRVVLIGYGEKRDALARQIDNLNISQSVIITEHLGHSEAMVLFATSDIAILVSDWEGFPMVNIEALQLGLPVITNAVGGIAEAVDNTVGRLLPRDVSAEELFLVIKELVLDSSLREKLSGNAVNRGQLFTTKKMCNETFAVYDSIVK